MLVARKTLKINEKEADDGPFKKKLQGAAARWFLVRSDDLAPPHFSSFFGSRNQILRSKEVTTKVFLLLSPLIFRIRFGNVWKKHKTS